MQWLKKLCSLRCHPNHGNTKRNEAKGFAIAHTKAQMHCKAFEDNSGAVEIAWVPKYCPQTKHLNCKLHHFRSHVDEKKEISVHHIWTENQCADMLTKPNDVETLQQHRKTAMWWWHHIVITMWEGVLEYPKCTYTT